MSRVYSGGNNIMLACKPNLSMGAGAFFTSLMANVSDALISTIVVKSVHVLVESRVHFNSVSIPFLTSITSIGTLTDRVVKT